MTRFVKLSIAILTAMVGWILYFISGFVTRDTKKIVFGTHTGTFSGNVKALYLDESYKKDAIKIFIYRNENIKASLEALDGKPLYFSYLSFKGIYHTLTAGTFVYSSYASDINYWLSKNAKLFNVWHGTPLKKIERDVTTGFYSIRNKYEFLFKYIYPHLFVRPNQLLVCSEYEKACFKTAFDVSNEAFVEAFPPRLNTLKEDYINEINKNFIIYAPTWRDDSSFQFYKNCDLNALNEVMEQKGLTFLIKPHPSDKMKHLDKKYSHIKLAPLSEDFYVLVKKAKLAVTDYSSVMFDCMYCNIPVVLFCPDLKSYMLNSRDFYCDIKELPFPLMESGNDFIRILNNNFTACNSDKFLPYKNTLT
ncbi:CDP-glycerol glycerophosphotransferase family protein [[Mannheimia] succiniciproducens]|uniref:TagB protein n=1 Tax=Mannheimia succiniciproducens (strain KCTC 0769BP / MBEL55E) TaxID=221988 RepID=Q65UU4_MANSM|nr:CDP-glycerol glycerophosphotransferase family protein [[Mannheimia] succiniciproducens]AAU37266.1 TagB protein [[Mannheimia] succiniciproducens MBEL55E]